MTTGSVIFLSEHYDVLHFNLTSTGLSSKEHSDIVCFNLTSIGLSSKEHSDIVCFNLTSTGRASHPTTKIIKLSASVTCLLFFREYYDTVRFCVIYTGIVSYSPTNSMKLRFHLMSSGSLSFLNAHYDIVFLSDVCWYIV